MMGNTSIKTLILVCVVPNSIIKRCTTFQTMLHEYRREVMRNVQAIAGTETERVHLHLRPQKAQQANLGFRCTNIYS